MKKKVLGLILAICISIINIGVPVIVHATDYRASRIVDYVNNRVGESYANGYCLRFVDECFNNIYGYREYSCCAYSSGNSYIDSSSRDNIPLGSCIFFGGSTVTCSTCGNKAGHIGIYVGDGYIVHAWAGKVTKSTIDYIVSRGYPYRGYGWLCNIELTGDNPPSNPRISLSSRSLMVGDTLTLTYSADNANNYRIGYNIDGESLQVVEKGSSTSASLSFSKAGKYIIHVQCLNSAGSIDTEYVSFTVYDKPLWRSYAIASTYQNGHLYSLFDMEYDWDMAKSQVENKGGYLATITSEEENAIVTNLISKGSKNQYWIGYTDKDKEGTWKWITSEESNYTNWNSGEPNNSGGAENYGTYSKSTKKWNDTIKDVSSVGILYEAENFAPTASIYNNNIKYELYDYGMSWTEAKQFCEDMGGHLATITSASEDSAIAELVKKGKWADYWIGCTDEEQEGTWKWVTGENFDYTNWNSSEPNNSDGIEHYGSYVQSRLKWNDAPNVRTKYGIIVEYNDESRTGYLPNKTIVYDNSVLAVYNRQFSWTEAQEFCQSASGNLVTIEDAEKQNAVVNLVRNAGSHFFIGYTDKDSEGNWKWISGKNSTYTNWNSGEPNNSDGNEDYAELNQLQDGKWNDIGGGISADIYRGFVLEINNLEYAAETKFNENTYYRFDNPMPWTEAKAYCEMLGGHLVSIASEEENTAMKELISDGAKSAYWLGYTDYAKEGTYVWIDKTNSSYSNWNVKNNEPNNAYMSENYATILKSGLWNDLRNSEFINCGFICEIEGDKPEDTPIPTDAPSETEKPSPTVEPTEKPTLNGAKISVSSSNAFAGDTVEMTVNISENTGFSNLGLEIGYDSDVLTLISAEGNTSVGAIFTPAKDLNVFPYNITWNSTSNNIYNGTLATLKFKVSEKVESGNYPVTVDFYKGISGNYDDGIDVNYDENLEPLNLSYMDGNINVSTHIAGDINGDSKVNNQDGTFLLRYLSGWEVKVDNSALDVNGDGKVNNQDGTVLLRYLSGWNVDVY